jgi:ABC-type transport system substrate-binding protein
LARDALPNVLRVGASDHIRGLNPFAVADKESWRVLDRIFDRMTTWNWTDRRVAPWIAVEWCHESVFQPVNCATSKGDENPLNITVRYRVGDWALKWGGPVKFHDGKSAWIEDILFSYVVQVYNGRWVSSVRQLIWDNASGHGWGSPPYGDNSFARVTVGGPGGVEGWVAIRVADNHTLQFRLSGPSPMFANSTLPALLLPRHIWNSHIDMQNGTGDYLTSEMDHDDATGRAPGAVGSGPFKLDRWIKGQFSRLLRNDTYFDWTNASAVDDSGRIIDPARFAFPPSWTSRRPVPRVQGIEPKIYITPEAKVLAIQQAQVDYISDIPDSMIPDLEAGDKCTDLNNTKVNCRQVIGISRTNTSRGPFVILNLRRQPIGYDAWDPKNASAMNDVGAALRKAVDLSIPVDWESGGVCIDPPCSNRTRGPLSPDMTPWYNDSLPKPVHDPAEATRLLDAEGWARNPSCPKIGNPPNYSRLLPRIGCGQLQMLTPEAAYDPPLAILGQIVESGAQAVGINLKAVPTARGKILQLVGARDFDLALMRREIGGVPGDWLNRTFDCAEEAAGENDAGYCSRDYDSLMRNYSSASDLSVRIRFARDGQGLLAEDLPWIRLAGQGDVLVEAFRKDRFVVPQIRPPGWIPGPDGIYNQWSLLLIDQPRQSAQLTVTGASALAVCRTATLTAAYSSNGSAIAGAHVLGRIISGDLTFSDGNVSSQNVTDLSGNTRFIVRAGSVAAANPAIVEFTAEKPGYQRASVEHSMRILADGCGPPPIHIGSMLSSPQAIGPGGAANILVEVVSLGDWGPVPNATILFSSPNVGTIEPMMPITNQEGRAVAVYSASGEIRGNVEVRIRAVAQARIGGHELVSEEATTTVLVTGAITDPPATVAIWPALLIEGALSGALLLTSWLLAPRQWRRLLPRRPPPKPSPPGS